VETNELPDVLTAASAIKRYLAARPDALDTLQGVARWWVSRQRLGDSLEIVQRALDHLEAQGDVVCLQSPDGLQVYRRVADSHG
jgi:hypothetical protein